MQAETELHLKVCAYLSLYYPEVIYTSDLSGVKMPKATAYLSARMRSRKGIPDLLIFEPRAKYHGLFIELKTDNVNIYRKNGNFTSKHIQEQYNTLKALERKGYCTAFGIGYEMTTKIIKDYMSLQ